MLAARFITPRIPNYTQMHRERRNLGEEMKHTNEMMSRNWQPCFFRDDIQPKRNQKRVENHSATAE